MGAKRPGACGEAARCFALRSALRAARLWPCAPGWAAAGCKRRLALGAQRRWRWDLPGRCLVESPVSSSASPPPFLFPRSQVLRSDCTGIYRGGCGCAGLTQRRQHQAQQPWHEDHVGRHVPGLAHHVGAGSGEERKLGAQHHVELRYASALRYAAAGAQPGYGACSLLQ